MYLQLKLPVAQVLCNKGELFTISNVVSLSDLFRIHHTFYYYLLLSALSSGHFN